MSELLAPFLVDIRGAPEDDAPRLRAAEELAARGDPRGEFIKVQVELARLDPESEAADALALREKALLASYGAQWIDPIADGLIDWTFRRGFVEDVTLSAEALLQYGDNLVSTEPVRAIRVVDPGGAIEELSKSTFLERIVRLTIGSDDGDAEPIGEEGLRELADSPHLANLRELAFGMEQFEEDGLAGLGHASWLGSLTRLSLSGNAAGDEALQSFLAEATLTRLERLDLAATGAQSGAIMSLARSRAANTLRELILTDNQIGVPGLDALTGAGVLPQLVVLDLAATGLEPGNLAPLCRSALLARLTKLSIAHNRKLTPDDLSALLSAPLSPVLKDLELSGKYGDAGAEIVAQSAVLARLERLDLSASGITAPGIALLASSPHPRNLRALELFSNRAMAAGAAALASSPALTNLTRLGISNNAIGDDGVRALAQSPYLTRLRSLSIRACEMSDKGVEALAAGKLDRLRSIDLAYNGLTDRAAAALAGSAALSNLDSLILANNKIGREGARAFAASKELALIRNLDLTRNSVGPEGAAVLREAFGRRARVA